VQTNGIPTGVLVQDCDAPSTFALRSYLVWGEGSHFVLLGNKVVNSANEHAIRAYGMEYMLIAYGDYANPAIYDWEINKNALNIQKADYVTIYANKLSNGNQLGPLGGADGVDKPDSRLRNVVFESNLLEGGWLRIAHGAENLMLKNNVIKQSDMAQIIVDGYDSDYQRGVVNLNIVNNTGINHGTTGRFLWLGGSSEGVSVINNVYRSDNLIIGSSGAAAIQVANGDMSSFRTIANNVWPVPASVTKWIKSNAPGGTGIMVVGSQNRANSYYNIGTWNAQAAVLGDFQQNTPLANNFAPGGAAAANGAKYAGIFTDYWGNARPLNAAWSIGAVEI